MVAFFGIVGACVTVYASGYIALRLVATIIDIYFRWRDDDWEFE